MERPKREDFDKICRLCLKNANLVNIFERNPETRQESLSPLVRETVGMLGLTIATSDPYPRKICLACKDILRVLHKFRQQAQEANDLVMEACPPADQEMPLAPPIVIPLPRIPSTSAVGFNGVKNGPKNVSQKAPPPKDTRRPSQSKPAEPRRNLFYSCYSCDFKCQSPKALSTHLIDKHPSQWICAICGQQFIDYFNLEVHKLNVHNIMPRLRGS